MKIVSPKYILTQNGLKQNLSFVFKEKIIDIDSYENLIKKYGKCEEIELKKDSLIVPAFINLHTHLEFSSNSGYLEFGNFNNWLISVFKNRDKIFKDSTIQVMKDSLNNMLNRGTTTIGAISSNGNDLKACVNSKARIIYFNEVIGSSAQIGSLYNDFKDRVYKSLAYKNSRFIPAIALHSPYSLSKKLSIKSINLAKELGMYISAHFCESSEEIEWLRLQSGTFKETFDKFLNVKQPSFENAIEFLRLLDGYPSFLVHLTKADNEIMRYVKEQKHSIIHCPVSNRLLTNDKLDIKNLNSPILATDGLSSNFSLDILNEAKMALFIHYNDDLNALAKKLIEMITIYPAKALNMQIGSIKKDYLADFLIIENTGLLNNLNAQNIYIRLILEEYNFTSVFIEGKNKDDN